MFFGTSAQPKLTLSVNVVTVAGSSLPIAIEMKSLGVVLVSRLSFDFHVTAVCRAYNYHIWALFHNRQLLPNDVARTLACSIVTTRLDYYNSLMYITSNRNLAKLQMVQNSLAYVVTNSKTHTRHSSAVVTTLASSR